MTRNPELKFEDALTSLAQLVSDLENGEADLSTALAKYEQGIQLLSHCHGVLDRADRTVALLTGIDEGGSPLTAPFDATATADREPNTDSPQRQKDTKES